MTRARYFEVAADQSGRPIPGVTVNVYQTGTTTPIVAPIYSAATGGGTLSNPLVANDQGEIEFFLAVPARVDLAWSKTRFTSETHPVDVIAADAFVLVTEKGAANGVATLDSSSMIPDAQIPAAIARDSETTAAVATETTNRTAADAAHAASPTAHSGTSIANTPAGNIAATTVQAALNELDTEKAIDALVVHLAGTETITGTKTFNVGTILDKGSQLFNVKAYGAVGDGTTDDTAAINAAIAAIPAAGGILYFPPGSYLLTSAITVPDKTILRGAGIAATRIVYSVDLVGSSLINFTGTSAASDTTTLTVNTSVGNTALTVASTASLVADAYYVLGSDAAFSTENPLRYKGEIVRILSVDSGTGVTLYGRVRDLYQTTAAASLRALTFRQGNGIEDLSIVNTAPATTTTQLVTFSVCKDVRVRNVRTEGIDGHGFALVECLGVTIVGYHAQNHADDTANGRFGYGINVNRATENVAIVGCHFVAVRHGVTCDGNDNKRGVPRNVVVSGCTASLSTAAAFDTHATGQFFTFVGCSATQSVRAFQVRAQDTRILGCSASHCTTGVEVLADAHGLRIEGSVFRHLLGITSSQGVAISSTTDRVTIAHCTFDSLAGYGVNVTGNAKRIKVLGCEFSNIGQGGTRTTAIVFGAAVTSPQNVIANNTFINETPGSAEADVTGNTMTVAVDLGGAGVTASYVYNNLIIGALTGAIANLGTNFESGNVSDQVTAPTGIYHRGQTQYYFPQPHQATSTSNALGNGTLRLGPAFVDRTLTITKIGGEITVVGEAGSLLRLGVYADDGNGYPGARLLDAGTIAADSATVQEISVSLTLTPGLYWVGGAVQSAPTTQPTVRTASTQNLAGATSIPGANATQFGYQQTSVTGALPGTFTASIGTSGAFPRVFWKAAA